MNDGVIVRPAEPADAARVAEIYAHYVETSAATFEEPPAPSAETTAARIAAAALPFVVAEVDGAVAGYAYLAPYMASRTAYRFTATISVYVAPDARRGGIGRALLSQLLADGAAAGIREVLAIIAVTDDPASISLHARCGFREAGRLRSVGFKHGRWHDTVLMQLSLSD
jgi:L-amino acid N-acyltransferase YncA